MNQKRWKISKMLLALPILAAALTGASAASELAAVCQEFPKLLTAPPPRDFIRSQLDAISDPKQALEHYLNLDIDGDDINDFIEKGCPGNLETGADPCMLSIKLSSSGNTLTFEAWGFELFRYHGQIFIAANADKTGRKTNIFRIEKSGFKLVCAKL